MSLLQWKPSFSLGIPSVDLEHRELIDMINTLHGQLQGNDSAAQVTMALAEIHAAIAAHFALEERVMLDASYCEYGAHKHDHEELLDEIRELMDRYLANPAQGRELLRQRLSDWFGRHFASFDARFHRELRR